jgi:hypothetical protein
MVREEAASLARPARLTMRSAPERRLRELAVRAPRIQTYGPRGSRDQPVRPLIGAVAAEASPYEVGVSCVCRAPDRID